MRICRGPYVNNFSECCDEIAHTRDDRNCLYPDRRVFPMYENKKKRPKLSVPIDSIPLFAHSFANGWFSEKVVELEGLVPCWLNTHISASCSWLTFVCVANLQPKFLYPHADVCCVTQRHSKGIAKIILPKLKNYSTLGSSTKLQIIFQSNWEISLKHLNRFLLLRIYYLRCYEIHSMNFVFQLTH